jgi:Phage capsid family
MDSRNAAATSVPVTSVPEFIAYAKAREGDPIPNRALSFSGPRLEPRKFATEATFTREVFEHSTPTIESIVRATLTESVGLALDQAMFSSAAGDSTKPPGLLQGIAASTPSANSDHDQACTEDLVKLAASVRTVAANAEIIFIASANQFERLQQRFSFLYRRLASSALADKTVICVAANCIASATDPRPRFDISSEATVHLDTAPQAIGTGTVPTVAVPTVSLYQSDLLSLKMVFEMSYVLRHASGLAWMSSVVW